MNEYISSRKLKELFKGKNFTFNLSTININGQKRGCSGFITNPITGKHCYITTEPFFEGGLYGDKNRTIMMRTAAHLKDYSGGVNQWLSVDEIVQTAGRITAETPELIFNNI